jgi:glycosyltransferase involved in cell wall biosynthesis
LSYELATPNKFFQALAVGIPIIASEGTYLSKIVIEHGVGVIFTGDNLREIRLLLEGDAYEKWVSNISILRSRLRASEVVI